MKHPDVFAGTIPAEAVKLNPAEAAARLKTARNFENPLIASCRDRLLSVVAYRYAAVRLSVSFPEEGVCDFGFAAVKSKHLAKNLFGCREVFLFAVTTGLGVDRLLSRLAAVGSAENFITDALASAAAESVCEAVSESLGEGEVCRLRFSPGYGDLPLDFQKPLLERLDAYERLGITLNSAFLMTPVKSVTAIMGIEP